MFFRRFCFTSEAGAPQTGDVVAQSKKKTDVMSKHTFGGIDQLYDRCISPHPAYPPHLSRTNSTFGWVALRELHRRQKWRRSCRRRPFSLRDLRVPVRARSMLPLMLPLRVFSQLPGGGICDGERPISPRPHRLVRDVLKVIRVAGSLVVME